ncbi:MAG: hypothetical protein IJ106_05670 [Parasporobacterium sp.]|nr:hypothetical protein [Parasporobacterium sp.]
MTFWYILLLILALAAALVFTVQRAMKTDEKSLLLKTVASIAFVLLGFVSFRGSDGVISVCLLPGLVMGLIGDIYLDLKYVHPGTSTTYTFAGFGAFILGHLFYLAFLFRQYPVSGAALVISILIGIAAGIGIYVTPERMRLNYGKFRVISACYAALLVFVTVYALCLCFAGFTAAKLLFFLGIALFLFSDLVLSQIYFGENKNTPLNSMINHGAYYLGQILIAASLFLIR